MHRTGSALALVIALVTPAAGATEGTDLSEPAPRYFAEPAEWQFKWGTDAAFTVSNLESGSTNEANDRTTSFDRTWMRLYGRVLYKDSAELLVDVFSANGGAPSIFGMYARLQPCPWAGLRVGILPLIVSGWQERAYPSRQPLINQPLFAQYLLPLRSDSVPTDVSGLLAYSAGAPAATTTLGPRTGGSYLTLAYEHCWDTGVEGFGEWKGLRYRVGLMDGPPGSGPTKSRDQDTGTSYEGRLTYRFGDVLRVGASAAKGPYLLKTLDPFLPPGHTSKDYDQDLLGADARLRVRFLEVHGEWMNSRFRSPFVQDGLTVDGYYAEGVITLREGAQLAARYSGLTFGDVHDKADVLRRWDDPLTRLEVGGVYRALDSHVAVKAVYQATRVKDHPPTERIYALQVSFFY